MTTLREWRGLQPGPEHYDVVLRVAFRDRHFRYLPVEGAFLRLLREAVGEPVVERRGRAERHACDEGLWAQVAGEFPVDSRPRQVLVNWNSPLGYHVDVTAPYRAANVMVTLRHACRGGLTVFPERRLAVEPQDGWMLMFDGQREVHGVTPLLRGEDGWRCSVVFYTPLPNDEEATDDAG